MHLAGVYVDAIHVKHLRHTFVETNEDFIFIPFEPVDNLCANLFERRQILRIRSVDAYGVEPVIFITTCVLYVDNAVVALSGVAGDVAFLRAGHASSLARADLLDKDI